MLNCPDTSLLVFSDRAVDLTHKNILELNGIYKRSAHDGQGVIFVCANVNTGPQMLGSIRGYASVVKQRKQQNTAIKNLRIGHAAKPIKSNTSKNTVGGGQRYGQ